MENSDVAKFEDSEQYLDSPNSSACSLNAEQPDLNKVSFTFRWTLGGREVQVIGAFNSWTERLRMQKEGNEFVLNVELERGNVFQYKFIVDGEWRFAPEQPTTRDKEGNINNYIDTNSFPEPKRVEPKQENVYSQDYCSDFISLEPDPLPLHLHYVIANHSNTYDYRQKQTRPFNSPIRESNGELAGENALPPNELPTPPHVVLNHLALRTKDRVIGLSMTQRYKEKFVTTIYYKPYSSC